MWSIALGAIGMLLAAGSVAAGASPLVLLGPTAVIATLLSAAMFIDGATRRDRKMGLALFAITLSGAAAGFWHYWL